MARLPMSIEPALRPLVVAMHRESGGTGRIFEGLGGEREFARTLRADLLLAGVTRHELHHASKNPPREWMTMHDLRTTGITWMAVRGDQLLIVKARAGHSDTKMTEHYINLASVLRQARYGEVFPPLPRSLLGEHAPPVVVPVPTPAPRPAPPTTHADDPDDDDRTFGDHDPVEAVARVLH
ncbi:MAG: hypothetical protein ACHREM_23015 [Polyangiales bacterium]